MKKAILHIGTEKTGTKTLQELLFLNKEQLANNGTAILNSTGHKDDRNLATYCLSSDKSDDHTESLMLNSILARENWKRKLEFEIDNEIKLLDDKIHTVIISSEHLHSRLTSEEEVLTLRKLLNKYFDKFKIIVYLRRQDEVATSLYSTALRVGLYVKKIIPDPTSRFARYYYDYQLLLDRWENIFGKDSLQPRIFSRSEFIDNNLISDFLNCCEIDSSKEIALPQNENEALSATLQQVLLSFNHYSPWRQNNALHRKMINLIINHFSSILPGAPMLPTRKDAESFLCAFVESNRHVAEKWFNREELFDECFAKYPEKQCTNTRISSMLATFLPSCQNQDEVISLISRALNDQLPYSKTE